MCREEARGERGKECNRAARVDVRGGWEVRAGWHGRQIKVWNGLARDTWRRMEEEMRRRRRNDVMSVADFYPACLSALSPPSLSF